MKFSLRNCIAYLFAKLLLLSGARIRAFNNAKNEGFIFSFYFHKPTMREFESVVLWFKKNNFTFLSMEDLKKISYEEIPISKLSIIFTVDDGWESNLINIVQVIEKYKIPICIFITSEAVEIGNFWFRFAEIGNEKKIISLDKKSLKNLKNDERLNYLNSVKSKLEIPREAMKIEDIKRISSSEYITFGSHSHTHPILPSCNLAQVRSEIEISKNKLEDWTGKPVDIFAYPNGDYGKREINLLKEAEFKFSFSTERNYITYDKLKNNPFELPRFGFLEGASFEENLTRALGIWKFR